MAYSGIKGAKLTLNIEEVNSYGCGVAHADDGRVIFVNGAVTGDAVLCEIIKADKKFSVARIVEVIEPSPHRADEPFCKAPNACGGCTYRHMKYSSEKDTKRGIVVDAFRRAGLSDADILPVLSTDETKGYRNKVIYPIASGKDGLIYGYYAQSSHKVIPCDDCALSNPTLSALASKIVAILNNHNLSAYNEQTGKGLVRHLYMRIGEITGEILVCLVINGKGIPAEERIAREIKALDDKIVGVLLNSNEKNTNVVLGKGFRILLGRDFICDVLCGKMFRIHASAFWQVNRKAAELLYNTGFDMADIKKGDTVADLYCGIGSIGISASDRASRIFGVEIVNDAVKCAYENAALNLVENAEYVCADAADSEKAIGELFDKYPDALCILDPPRKGCGDRLMHFLASKNVKKILYISCNPYSLATDVAAILPLGYEMSSVQPVDLFPRTGHVETVVLLSQLKSTDHIKVELDLSDEEPTVSESKGTYDDIKKYIYERYQVKVSSLYISQVKRKLGLPVGECYNKPKSEEVRVPNCPEEKEKLIVEALRHFKMI